MEETQNVALPEDASDPYLRKWVKIPENPILKHPEGVRIDDFRDPSTAWQLDDGSWRMIVGTQYGTNGTALLYRSDDLVHWELMEKVLHTIPETGMWECLDFYPVPCEGKNGLDTSVRGPSVKHVLKVSAFDTKRDYYAVGSYDVVTEAFTPINQELDVIYALQFDEGKFYASKSFYDPVKQRRINWGWTNESDSEAHDIAKGWASLLVSKFITANIEPVATSEEIVDRCIECDSSLQVEVVCAVSVLESPRSLRRESGSA
jgi:beta-fructofuranosidase